jgi:hypothetical protein
VVKLKGKELEKYEAARNLGAELLLAVRDMKAGKAARRHRIKIPKVPKTSVRS